MRRFALVVAAALLVGPGDGFAGDVSVHRTFETAEPAAAATPLDAFVLAAQKKRGVEPANPCSDEVFVRRVFLDLIGTLPEPVEVREFRDDRRPGKRAALVERLFSREEFADYWALKWCDLLRVKSEFPIDLWPNAVQAFHRWIRDCVRENRPYDRFAWDLLTSSGSNVREPEVNFYRAVRGRTPQAMASAAALAFLGERIENWPESRRSNLARFFSRVAFKKTGEWKEEIVLSDPAPAEALDAFLPDGTAVRVPEGEDPRRAFAQWLIDPRDKAFARAVVNRAWSWFFGRGVVHEPDDMRPDNPPAVPGLLEHLAKELVGARYDLRHVFRLIVNSRTYQQSPIPRGDPEEAEDVFACYPPRRLDAEVLIDALDWIGGTGQSYSSTTPEPYTYLPEGLRTIALADGSITSPFLLTFGRPARDTGLESERTRRPSDAQRLWLLNSSDVHRRLQRSPWLSAAFASARGDLVQLVGETYLVVLSRAPTDAETAIARAWMETPGRRQREAALDLAWALVNTKEFLYRH